MKPNLFEMKTLLRLILSLSLLSGSILIFSGCEEKSPYDSSIPWSRPADWENQMPGMGGMGG